MLKMLTIYKPAWSNHNIVNGGELKKFTDIGIKFSFLHLFKYILSKVVALTLSGPGGGGRAESAPPKVFLHNSKTPGDIEKNFLTLTLHL